MVRMSILSIGLANVFKLKATLEIGRADKRGRKAFLWKERYLEKPQSLNG